jgi:hypothetical protein
MTKTKGARAIYWLFIYIAAMWALVVIDKTSAWEDGWKAWGLAAVGAALIAFIGLRLSIILDTRWSIAKMNAMPRLTPAFVDGAAFETQTRRQPYIRKG